MAALPGVRLVVLPEVEENRRLSEVAFKDLTGQDVISARHLYQNHFSFSPVAKYILSGNHRPVVRGTDLGVWRRIALVNFRRTIPEEKVRPMAELLDGFRSEAAGILSWLIEGWTAYQAGGLNIPRSVREATDQYRSDSDAVSNFLAEETTADPIASTAFGEMYDTFRHYGSDGISRRRFGELLREHGVEVVAGSGNRKFVHGRRLLS
jgi:putative DNA primase/helicase